MNDFAQAAGPNTRVLLFDVNETLSDMAPLASRFEDVGAPSDLATAWFASLLRDGFALAVAGVGEPFAEVGAAALRTTLHGQRLTGSLDEAVDHVMNGFTELDVHPDVVEGLQALRDLGLRLVTLSNGAASVAEGLLERAGAGDLVERYLSVEDVGVWKPARAAYAYGVAECQVEPEEAMLVAVHPWDTDGAARTGLQSAWINRSGTTFPGYFRPPDLEASSLVDLAVRLGVG